MSARKDGFHLRAGGPQSATVSYGSQASLRIEAGNCSVSVRIADGAILIQGSDAVTIEPIASNSIAIRDREAQP